MNEQVIFWIIAFVALTILELSTMQLVCVWFAAGALISIFLAALGIPIWVQAVEFVLVSILLLSFTRPVLRKIMSKTIIPTNSELDIGKTAVVIEAIDNVNLTGRVTLNGVDWIARSTNGQSIDNGTTVMIEKIDGAKVLVKVK